MKELNGGSTHFSRITNRIEQPMARKTIAHRSRMKDLTLAITGRLFEGGEPLPPL